MFSLGTSGFGSDDTKINLCGVTIGHALPIIKVLKIEEAGVVHKIYMVKDPRGLNARTDYNQTWSYKDT
jgi:hypothetical protein